MREALARSDHDFVLSEPRPRRKASSRPKFFTTLAAMFRFACRLAAYPNRIAGALVFGLAIAIMVNALLLQHSRHPAPLFHKSIVFTPPPAPAHVPLEKPAAAAIPEPVLAPHDPIGQLIKAETHGSGQRPAILPHEHATRREGPAPTEIRPASHDPISQLLHAERPPAQPAPAQDPSKTVFAVQHALVKLGFVLRADGRMGGVTRRAIEQYEHDRGLPIHAELTPKLLRRLAVESGLKIE